MILFFVCISGEKRRTISFTKAHSTHTDRTDPGIGRILSLKVMFLYLNYGCPLFFTLSKELIRVQDRDT